MSGLNRTPRKRNRRKRVQGSNGRGNGSRARGPPPLPRKKFSDKAYRDRKVMTTTVVGAGYDVKVMNPGAEITGARNDEIILNGRLAVANWAASIIGGVHQNYFFAPLNTILTGSPTNIIYINPLALFPASSRDYNVSEGYAQFRFSKIKMIIQSTTATNIAASGVVAYAADGALTGGAFDSSSEILAYPNAMALPAWGSRTLDVTDTIQRGIWYYTDVGATGGISSDSDYRQALQGCFGGYTNGFAVSADVTDGYVFGICFLEYTLHLKGPRIAGNYVLSGKLARTSLERRAAYERKMKLERTRFRQELEERYLAQHITEHRVGGESMTAAEPDSVLVEQPSPPRIIVSGTPVRPEIRADRKDRKAEK